MKKYFVWFFILLKRQLNYRLLTAFLLLMPIVTFFVVKIPAMNENTIPRIGLYAYDDDVLSQETIDALINESYNTVIFYREDSLDNLKKNIINKKTDCGYAFKENLSLKISEKQNKNCIQVFNSASSVMSSLANEMVFSKLFEIFGKEISLNYADVSEGLKGNSDIKDYIEERFYYYLNGPATFFVEFKAMDENSDNLLDFGNSYDKTNISNEFINTTTTDIQVNSKVFPLRGILAILIFTAGILGTILWLKDYENGVFKPATHIFKHVSRFYYVFIPTILFAISSLLTLYCANEIKKISQELIALGLYITLITIFNIILSHIIKSSKTLIALLPMFILSCLVLCPIVISFKIFIPAINILEKFMLPYYYLIFF